MKSKIENSHSQNANIIHFMSGKFQWKFKSKSQLHVPVFQILITIQNSQGLLG